MGIKLHSFANGIKKARKKAGYTQETFARAINMSKDTIRNWEQSRSIPEVDTILMLCDFFSCDIDYLFDRIECKTHDLQFISDRTGLSEESIESLSQISYDPLNKVLLEYLLQDGNELINSLGKYLVSFVAEDIKKPPYSLIPLKAQIDDSRTLLADLIEKLPQSKAEFRSLLETDEKQYKNILYHYLKPYADIVMCGMTVKSALLVNAINTPAGNSIIMGLPDKSGDATFDQVFRDNFKATQDRQSEIISDFLTCVGISVDNEDGDENGEGK